MIKEVHVVPFEDLKTHNLSFICSCNPTFETYPNGNIIASHNSYDRREIDDFIVEILEDFNPKPQKWAAICLDRTHHSN